MKAKIHTKLKKNQAAESVINTVFAARAAAAEKKTARGDILIPILAVLLSVFGIVMIYASSSYSAKADYNDAFFFVKKQAAGLLGGISGLVTLSFVPYNKFKRAKWAALIISLVLLSIIFIPGVGKEKYGALRWIALGPITVQPSEIAKFGFVIFAAAYIADKTDAVRTLKGCLPILLSGTAICALIILEPNMSITMCVGLLMLAMIFLGGLNLKYFVLIIIPFIIFAVILIVIEPYRLNRLSAFLNPWASPKGEGYQLIQSLYALGSGGWFGIGLFNSRQKFEFLPFAESDFILSVIGEELGFVGMLAFFAVMFLLIYRGFKVMSGCKNLFGYMLSGGITLVYTIQVIINALVVTGSIPPTGLPLPLISSGNTALVVFLSSFGVLYNISKQND